MQYHNPVIPGFYPDPSVCRVGENYYLVTSSFEYFPGVPIFSSRDLINWKQIGHCLTRASQLPLDKAWSSGGVYAPTLRYHDRLFYMVTTNVSQGGHFYVTAEDPAGEWSEPIWIDHEGIDPSFMFDDDGIVYFCSTGQHDIGGQIMQSMIDLRTGRLQQPSRAIWKQVSGKSPEGAHLYKIKDMYYLMVAEGGTEYGHCEVIGRSTSPWGPFELCPHNPILTHRSQDNPIQVTGHADLVETHDGGWWLVFLAVRPNGYPPVYHLGRETFLAPVEWSRDGWPRVGLNGRVALEMESDCLPSYPQVPEPARDDFNQLKMGLVWNYLRNPVEEYYSLTERPGWLRLVGSAVSLDEPSSPTFVGRRQQHFECRASARLDYSPRQDGEEAGLVAFMNERHHYEIAVTSIANRRKVIVRRKIGSLQRIVAEEDISGRDVELHIQADRNWYEFSVTTDGGQKMVLSRGETRYLSTEVAGGFTGVYLGMYATGNGKPCAQPADFDWFEYIVL